MALDTRQRLDDPDALFAALVDAHHGLDDAASRLLDAQLVLLLANHVGRTDVVLEAIGIARAACQPVVPQPVAPQLIEPQLIEPQPIEPQPIGPSGETP
jgi:hypothetical protein